MNAIWDATLRRSFAAKLGEDPAFGDLLYEEYGALIAKHPHHHLRQFGL